MRYYCSELAPFTTVHQAHLKMLMQSEETVTILFLNDVFEQNQTALYFETIFAQIGVVVAYQQVSVSDVEHCSEQIYFDGLLEPLFGKFFASSVFLAVPDVYGYEHLPFADTYIFDDVPPKIAAFIFAQRLFGVAQEMLDVYEMLSYPRFQHSMRVRYLSKILAERHQVDVQEAQFAALFHDYAKEMPEMELKRIMEKAFSAYLDAPSATWHGFVAAYLLKDRDDLVVRPDVTEAIAFHSLGVAHYGVIGLVLFIADFCDYRRPFTVETKEVWQAAETSLYAGAYAKIQSIQAYFAQKDKTLYRTTEEMFRWLEEIRNKNEGVEGS